MNGSNIPDKWDLSSDVPQLNAGAKPFVPSFMKKPASPKVEESVVPVEVPVEVPVKVPVEVPEAIKVKTETEPVQDEVLDQQVDEEIDECKVEDDKEVVEVVEEEIEEVDVDEVITKPIADLSIKQDHLNVVFIGHVDAGKSTLAGQIMFLTGMVDKRTLEKYEREAKEKNRESWYLSWALDTNQEERDKGKTVEVGRAYFKTETKNFIILDAPGHKNYVPNMIGGTSQADIAVLVISARRGEFETGFEKGGQTREHAVLARVAGVQRLIVVINKMDDPTVKWSAKRYNECKDKLTPFLRKIGFNPSKDLYFLPCSGFTGANINKPQPENHPWYTDLPLLPYLDSLPKINRDVDGPVRMPIVHKHKDMGVIVMGKVESGTITRQQQLVLQPNKTKVKVGAIFWNENEVDAAIAGENVKLRLDGIEEEEICKGFVLCSGVPCTTTTSFIAQIAIIEYKTIIAVGFTAIMHLHSSVQEVTIKKFLHIIDRKGNRNRLTVPFVKQDQTVTAVFQTPVPVCIETFANFPRMARFALRVENVTMAIGKVLKVLAPE